MSETPTIHELMPKVMQAVGVIGKNQRNSHQNFNFRGIDDVMNALHEPLTKHGVYYVPEVLDSDYTLYATSNGTQMRNAVVTVAYTFYGPAGDSVRAVGMGEASDAGDKATAKALAIALKVALLHTFCIPTEEGRELDPDNHTSSWGEPAKATGGSGPTPTGQAAEGTAPSCPNCGSGVWDNREDPQRGNRPVFKCRDKGCDFATWDADFYNVPQNYEQRPPVTDWSTPEPVGGGQ